MWKKLLLSVLLVLLVLAGLFVLLIGPWPTYAAEDLKSEGYYTKAVAAVEQAANETDVKDTPQSFRAGWASRKITPPLGTPLSGFGDRKGKPSEGIHDDVFVKALALDDGRDKVVILAADMLIIPENIADLVRQELNSRMSIKPGNIFFSASHTHSGPGAWAPGLLASAFSGEYDPKIVDFLTKQFVDAAVEALETTTPASVAKGSVDAPQFIKNRTRDAVVDSELSFMVVEKEDKHRCYVASYSAHATVLGGSNMQFSGDWPGYLQRYVEQQTGQFAMYLGGALGSMGPNTPDVPGGDGFARASAMGEGLGQLVLQNTQNLEFNKTPQVGAIGTSIESPPVQLRINKKWRASPYFVHFAGIDKDAWISGVRVGDVYLVGMPCDFSGELSREIKAWAANQGLDSWVLSFNGDYVGYISPDRYYYDTDPEEGLGYEIGLMSWCGPKGGSLFTELAKNVLQELADKPAPAA